MNDRGAATRPFRDTRPLLQVQRSPLAERSTCRSGLVSRKGCITAPRCFNQPLRVSRAGRSPRGRAGRSSSCSGVG
ncbi:hypothetical protein E3U47_07580 [Pseudomonas sp. RIT623]|nr:hypothetical protein E3U47_07580 [Pseudomonas sp. RIT623]